MARPYRSNLPGAVFHLIARTQGQESWFTEHLKGRITEYIASAIPPSDARLLAYAVMSNHLHLVVQQGQWRLDRLMQPLLSRVAVLVQRTFGTEGHVFESRYRDYPCLDPDYARDVIVYTHLNAVRAGLVDRPAQYYWTSHRRYIGADQAYDSIAGVLAFDQALGLFASSEAADLEERRRSYGRYVAWRMQCDRHHARAVEPSQAVQPAPPRPPVVGGNLYWSRAFAPLFSPFRDGAGGGPSPRGPVRPELGEIARRTLVEHGSRIALDRVRSNEKTREVARLRRVMVLRMSAAGHRGNAIARYLRVSDQCISNILVSERRFPPTADG